MVSIITPVFNESENLREFHRRLTDIIRSIPEPSEIIYVDDGSSDQSYSLLRSFVSESPNVIAVRLNRNYGQTIALRCGIDYARGETIVFIDSDLQNDPADIPLLLAKLKEGFEVVSGWRKNRKDGFLSRVVPSVIANAFIRVLTGLRLHDIGCTLKACRRTVLSDIDLYAEFHRIIPLYAHYNGARIAEIAVRHYPRLKGRSHYGMARSFGLTFDMLSAFFTGRFLTRPMHFFGSIGIVLLTAGMGLFLIVAVRVFFFGGIWISPLIFISLMVFLMGFQVLLMGLLAEMLIKQYYKQGEKKPYRVAEESIPLR